MNPTWEDGFVTFSRSMKGATGNPSSFSTSLYNTQSDDNMTRQTGHVDLPKIMQQITEETFILKSCILTIKGIQSYDLSSVSSVDTFFYHNKYYPVCTITLSVSWIVLGKNKLEYYFIMTH